MVEVLIPESDIREAVSKLARTLTADYRGKPLTVLGVMTGSVVFLADLIRQLDLPLQVGIVQASSYRGQSTSPENIQINAAFLPRLAGRDVLLLDDIFDTGQTLKTLLAHLSLLSPSSLRSAVLLWKEGRQTVDIVPDYHCFKIPDRFVVGYGLDFNGDHRHLPFVGVL